MNVRLLLILGVRLFGVEISVGCTQKCICTQKPCAFSWEER